MEITECPEGAPRKLRAFIDAAELNDAEAASQIGISPPALSLLLRGKIKIGERAARKIEIWTGGKIKMPEWRSDKDREQFERIVPFKRQRAAKVG